MLKREWECAFASLVLTENQVHSFCWAAPYWLTAQAEAVLGVQGNRLPGNMGNPTGFGEEIQSGLGFCIGKIPVNA